MSTDDPSSEIADDRTPEAADQQPPTDATAESSASANVSLPEGFGEPAPDREASRWGGYALAALLAAVFLVGLVRLVYPITSVMVVGTLLALFGVLVGVLAARGRLRGS